MEAPAPKTLVFSFDGTGNEPGDAGEFVEDESITNVLKLHLLLGGGMRAGGEVAGDGAGKQLAFYYNGIGTREEGRSIPWFGNAVSAVNMMLAPKWGDAGRILREAEEDFAQHYRDNDRVVAFGYSRGAALARKFVSRLLTGEAEGPGCDSVAFLGVFDTVAAMNGVQRPWEDVSTDVLFEDGTLHGGVERAVHLVALDEDRVLFRPTLINSDPERPGRITEIWFPGVHGDVGGGYWHDGLSDGALEFMVARCEAALGHGISICDPGSEHLIRQLLDSLESGDRDLAGIALDDVISRPVIAGPAHEHTGGAVRLGRASRHVRVNEDDRATGRPPLVHRSVLDRFSQVPGYRPPALRGLTFRLGDGSGPWLEVTGVAQLSDAAYPPGSDAG